MPFGFGLILFTLRRFNTIFFLSFVLNLVRFTGVILATGLDLDSANEESLLLDDATADCTNICLTGDVGTFLGGDARFSLAPDGSL